MSKHAGPRDQQERGGAPVATVATIAVVGVLGLVVALVAVLRPDGLGQPGSAADLAVTTESVSPAPPPSTTASPSPPSPPASVLEAARLTAVPTSSPQQQEQQVGESGSRLRGKADKVLEQQPTTFRVSSFNVLGASHTNSGGNKSGWASAPTRMGYAVEALNSHDVDVVGLQEYESSQHHMFMARTGGRWGVYPGAAGGRGAVRQSIAWRLDTWELVSGATVPIPYFHGNRVPMPYVLLRNLVSGREVYFINVHNPASTRRWGDNERWRDAATAIELDLANRLQDEGHPVVLTGDFNEREEVFCRLTAGGTLRAANGGSVGGACAPPSQVGIDWIFGSASMAFSGYVRERSPLVMRATDHPIVVATATIPGG